MSLQNTWQAAVNDANIGSNPRIIPENQSMKNKELSEYDSFSRNEWIALGRGISLNEENLSNAGFVGNQDEILKSQAPLAELISMKILASASIKTKESEFLGRKRNKPTFVIALSGSVASGKSSFAGNLCKMLSMSPWNMNVRCVTTDGFLFPNRELERKGILDRKGFPESYDASALAEFAMNAKNGNPCSAPVYSHETYDIVEGRLLELPKGLDAVIIEGVCALQPASDECRRSLKDIADLRIYIDADERHIYSWYEQRVFSLVTKAKQTKTGFYMRYASKTDDEIKCSAADVWKRINLKNLIEFIEPTKFAADIIVRKDQNHAVSEILIRH